MTHPFLLGLGIIVTGIVLVILIISIGEYYRKKLILKYEQTKINDEREFKFKNECAIFAAQKRLKEYAFREAQAIRETESSRERILADLREKYALFCPGCGKATSLSRIDKMPEEAQVSLGVDPKHEEEPQKKKKK